MKILRGSIIRRHPRLAAGGCAVMLAVPVAVIAMITTPAQAHPDSVTASTGRAVAAERSGGAGSGSAPTVNWALSGTASATNAESERDRRGRGHRLVHVGLDRDA